jgi:diguanylate cyclase (GGDEF)-like protein/PAS domain S-box-containing protein
MIHRGAVVRSDGSGACVSDQLLEERQLERAALLALLTAGYAVWAVVSILLFRFEDGQAGIWLPNVFAVAVTLRNASLRVAPAVAAVFVGCLTANLLLGSSLFNSVFFSCANTVTVLAEVTLLRSLIGDRRPEVERAREYAAMLAVGAVVGPAIGAALLSAVAAYMLQWPFVQTFWAWVVGEGLGFAVLLPILLMANRSALRGLLARAKVLRLVVAVTTCVFLAMAASSWAQFPFILVIVPLMVAAALACPFELAVACGLVGAALVGMEVTGMLAGLEPAKDGFAYGFQLSVAVVAVLPFVTGLLIEQSRRDSRRIAESEQRFRRAMQDSAIGVAIVGLDGHIAETNRAFADMLGYTREELETMTFFQITYPEDVPIGTETMRRVRAGEADNYQFEKRYVRKDSKPVWARLSGSVIRDDETRAPMYLVSQIEDIDAQKHAQEAIAAAEKRWDFAMATAGQGLWDFDARKGRTTYSSTWEHMLGYGEDELDGDPNQWLALIHPDDRARVEEADRAYQAGRAPMFEAEFRMRHKQGHWVWILDRGMIVERERDGRMARAIGTLTDITARREAEERILLTAALLADEKERLRVTLDSIGDAVICTDAAMRVTFMNPVAERLTGIAESGALGRPLEEVYAPADEETGENIATSAALAALKQRVEHNSRAILSKKDGSRSSIREVVTPILNEKGEFAGSVIVFQDFTDARALQRRLAHAASHDSLTGLANRSSLLANMSELLARPAHKRSDDLFLFVDLDNFKTVNDTGGHAAGDLLLKRVADTIRETTRAGDVAARLGGDEFAIIIRNCTAESGTAMAERLIAAVGKLTEGAGLPDCNFGASVGVTTIGHDEHDVDAIIARADLACYEAKAGGRGRVAVLKALASRKKRASLARAS